MFFKLKEQHKISVNCILPTDKGEPKCLLYIVHLHMSSNNYRLPPVTNQDCFPFFAKPEMIHSEKRFPLVKIKYIKRFIAFIL